MKNILSWRAHPTRPIVVAGMTMRTFKRRFPKVFAEFAHWLHNMMDEDDEMNSDDAAGNYKPWDRKKAFSYARFGTIDGRAWTWWEDAQCPVNAGLDAFSSLDDARPLSDAELNALGDFQRSDEWV